MEQEYFDLKNTKENKQNVLGLSWNFDDNKFNEEDERRFEQIMAQISPN